MIQSQPTDRDWSVGWDVIGISGTGDHDLADNTAV